jgi:hypothetical protein
VSEIENPPAFPARRDMPLPSGGSYRDDFTGMTLRDWFAGQAIGWVADSNYPEWQIKAWFGERTGIRRAEIQAKAAYELADALLTARKTGEGK